MPKVEGDDKYSLREQRLKKEAEAKQKQLEATRKKLEAARLRNRELRERLAKKGK